MVVLLLDLSLLRAIKPRKAGPISPEQTGELSGPVYRITAQGATIMFCNQCGSPLGADQLVCPTCGRSIAETRTTVEIRTRVPQHLNLLAIFWFVLAAFRII